MKRGVRRVTKSLRTLSTIYVFCEDRRLKRKLVTKEMLQKYACTSSEIRWLPCTHATNMLRGLKRPYEC